MSTQPPFSNEPNPYAHNPNQPDPAQNPYSPGQQPNYHTGKSDLLAVPAGFLLVLGALSLALGIFQLITIANNGVPAPPNQDPQAAMGYKFGFWFSTIAIPLINAVVVLGSLAMLLRKAHPLAVAGAACGIVPICGPCFVLGMPFGIWAMVLLMKPEVKATFT